MDESVKNCQYTVMAYRKEGKIIKSSYQKEGIAVQLVNPVLKVQKTTDLHVKVSGDEVKGAYGYRLYRSTSVMDGYTLIAETSKKQYVDKLAKRGTTYYYKVAAYRNTALTAESQKIKSIKLLYPYNNNQELFPMKNGINVYIAGDSTTEDYSEAGVFRDGVIDQRGSWGEFLSFFFNRSEVQVNNYGIRKRSSRCYINEGRLELLRKQMQKGDYLFIQFGHNDCRLADEQFHVRLGTLDKDGIYPVEEGEKEATPREYAKAYGEEWYPEHSGTYKWYLYQYVEAALENGAIPVLVTPVSRLYYTKDGTIKPYHDSYEVDINARTNSYVTAMKQVYEEFRDTGYEIYLLDMCEETKKLYETAYDNDVAAFDNQSPLAKQLFISNDNTHSSKLGGFILAGAMSNLIREKRLPLAKYLQKPKNITVITDDDSMVVLTVDENSRLSAYSAKKERRVWSTKKSTFWTKVGQAMLDQLK